MLSLIIAASRQIILQYTYDSVYFKVVDRLTKVSAMLLGMALNFEKEVLNMFMIF